MEQKRQKAQIMQTEGRNMNNVMLIQKQHLTSLLLYPMYPPAGKDRDMVVGVQDMGVGVEEPDPSY